MHQTPKEGLFFHCLICNGVLYSAQENNWEIPFTFGLYRRQPFVGVKRWFSQIVPSPASSSNSIIQTFFLPVPAEAAAAARRQKDPKCKRPEKRSTIVAANKLQNLRSALDQTVFTTFIVIHGPHHIGNASVHCTTIKTHSSGDNSKRKLSRRLQMVHKTI